MGSKKIIGIVLGVVALLLVILGIMYFVEPAKSLLIGSISTGARANEHRPLWGAASLVLAVICGIGAWFTMKGGKADAGSSSTSTPTAAASK